MLLFLVEIKITIFYEFKLLATSNFSYNKRRLDYILASWLWTSIKHFHPKLIKEFCTNFQIIM